MTVHHQSAATVYTGTGGNTRAKFIVVLADEFYAWLTNGGRCDDCQPYPCTCTPGGDAT